MNLSNADVRPIRDPLAPDVTSQRVRMIAVWPPRRALRRRPRGRRHRRHRHLTGELATRSRQMTQAFESYNQMRVLKRPLTRFYLSFFLMVTLCILVGATWVGPYLAKGNHTSGPPMRSASKATCIAR